MITTHTPGPWHIGIKPGPIIYGLKGEQIADMRAAMVPEPEHKANTRLIAAAPMLLEACKIGLACCIAWGGKCEAKGEMILATESVRQADVIRRAIAQAKGEV